MTTAQAFRVHGPATESHLDGPPARRILVVEDERDIAELVALHLTELPARVTLAHDGPRGLALALSQAWDAIVLDLRLPGLSGLDLCRALRAQAAATPVLMLTARAGELDRVLGLELGADDYLTKPFSVLEMQARVRALLRRAGLGGAGAGASLPHRGAAAHAPAAEPAPEPLCAGPLKLDRMAHRAWLAGRAIALTPREFELLWHFMQQPGRVFTRDELLDAVWGRGHDGYEHTVNTHINRLRNKLGGAAGEPAFIHTVWGVGYRFEVLQ